MSSPIAHCPACGLDSPAASGVRITNATNITFIGSSTDCPRCGSKADILDGTFNFRDGLIEVLAAPDWSMQELRRLRRAAQEAEVIADEDPEAAIGRVAAVSARAGAFLRKVNEVEKSSEVAGLKVVLKYLAYATGGVLAYRSGVAANITFDDVARIVEETLRKLGS